MACAIKNIRTEAKVNQQSISFQSKIPKALTGRVLEFSQMFIAQSFFHCPVLPQQTVSFEEHPTLPLPPQPHSYTTVLNQREHDFYEGLIITPEESLHLESGTRDQSSTTWHRLRAERITSTSFKQKISLTEFLHEDEDFVKQDFLMIV
ncbi:unnamed protein product [Leuciscus chuanchicus]